jgi:transcriptional regulator with XRE-family HTH domain
MPKRSHKSHYRDEYQAVLEIFRTLRERTGLNQTEFAVRLQRTQSYVSGAERGAVRLDPLQVVDWVRECGSNMTEWGAMMDEAIGIKTPPKKATRKTSPKA